MGATTSIQRIRDEEWSQIPKHVTIRNNIELILILTKVAILVLPANTNRIERGSAAIISDHG